MEQENPWESLKDRLRKLIGLPPKSGTTTLKFTAYREDGNPITKPFVLGGVVYTPDPYGKVEVNMENSKENAQ
jgi:hypothetical protein